MGYYAQLIEFLKQAKTNDLKTKHFEGKYKNCKVKVSFGQGQAARIPWISFLKEPNTTSNGIYPVYLYYKDFEKLILAYGLSETNLPQFSWPITNSVTIKKYFKEEGLGVPDRYGESFICKVYNASNLPDERRVEEDLDKILEVYDSLNFEEQSGSNIRTTIPFKAQSFLSVLSDSGLQYTSMLVIRFIASLITKPFVILTGLSGSGKTKLAQAFAQWLCEDKSQYCIVPVGADWTNREPLLGYLNALKPDEYVKPDNRVLDLIIQANNCKDLPHFLILDEMNLSHVERYFADFLSVMESKEDIPLFAEGAAENGVPANLKLPSNLFIIGTVNIDETTNMFSPKVLDRANTIEFRISETEMSSFLNNVKDIKMDELNAKGVSMAKNFLLLAENRTFATEGIDFITSTLIRFFGQLIKNGAEFGYRSATEIHRLINQLSILDNSLSANEKLDIAIMQKLLPKLHGSRRKLCPVLVTLGSFCVEGDLKIENDIFENDNFDYKGENVLFPLALEKIARMYRGAIDNGFASFAEA